MNVGRFGLAFVVSAAFWSAAISFKAVHNASMEYSPFGIGPIVHNWSYIGTFAGGVYIRKCLNVMNELSSRMLSNSFGHENDSTVTRLQCSSGGMRLTVILLYVA